MVDDIGKKCFMGNCLKLDPYHSDHCLDLEAQQGKWGKCLEYEGEPSLEDKDKGIQKKIFDYIGEK